MGWKRHGVISLSGNAERPDADSHEEQARPAALHQAAVRLLSDCSIVYAYTPSAASASASLRRNSSNNHLPLPVAPAQVTFALRVISAERLGIAQEDLTFGAFYLNPDEPALAAWDWESGPPPVSLASGSDCVLPARAHPGG